MTIARIFNEILAERERQDIKWGVQHHPDGTDTAFKGQADLARAMTDKAAMDGACTWWLILCEEAMEALAETEWPKLRIELIQCAAVIVQWLEDGDSRDERR